MITIYECADGAFGARVLEQGEEIPKSALWVDMESPDEFDLYMAQKSLGIDLPTNREVWKNQILNRLYIEDNVAYMTAALITKVDSPYPATSAVTFIMAPTYLLTMRSISPTSFRHFAERLLRNLDHFHDSGDLLEGLLEEIIIRVAYNSEIVVDTLDQLSHDIFGSTVIEDHKGNSSQLMKVVLKRLGSMADLNSKISESLQSLNRLLIFFKKIIPTDQVMDNKIDVLMTDTNALLQQAAFLSDKITFQLDATLGMINVEQNVIIKIFSMFTIFFLPPTLIGSMYGMNFTHMPELSWIFGYPMAVCMMIVFAVAPFVYFRKKKLL